MWQYNYSDPDALAHAGGFKYYQKVKTANGTRYFYSPQEYRNYLGAGNKLRSNANNIASTVKKSGLPMQTRGRLGNLTSNVQTGLPKMTYNARSGKATLVSDVAQKKGKSIASSTQDLRTKRLGQAVSAQKVLRKGEQNLKTSGKDARTYRIGQAVSAQKVLRKGEQSLQKKSGSSKLSKKVANSNTKMQAKPMSTEDVVKTNLSDAARSVVRKTKSAASNKKPTLLDRASDLYDTAKNEVSDYVQDQKKTINNLRQKRKITRPITDVTLGTLAPLRGEAILADMKKRQFQSQSINSMINDANRKNKAVSINSRDFTKRSLNSVLKEGKYYLDSGKRAIDSWVDRNSSKRYPVGREISRKTQQFFDDIGHEWRSFKRERKVKKIFGN